MPWKSSPLRLTLLDPRKETCLNRQALKRAGAALHNIMSDLPLTFAIPTYRLRDVPQTVQAYDENFSTNGHIVKLMVFDDSSPATQKKYYSLLEQTRTKNELYYVGPREKEAFIQLVNKRLNNTRLESLVRNLFRPSYGGNRNFTLIYTLGELLVSSDDDMRPYALIEDSPESLSQAEISRGKLVKPDAEGFSDKSFDILSSFYDVLGRPVKSLPRNFLHGEYVVDTAMDLETNATLGLSRENSLHLKAGRVPPNAIVKIAQTFRTGTNDIDAVDFVDLYLQNEGQVKIEDLNDYYALVNFRPVVTNKNWRMDCGVGGYDNQFGLPPFFPTRLRFEDYIYRLWIQRQGIVAAHVDSAQFHTKSNYMRNPPAAEIFNEEISNLLKRKIKNSLGRTGDLGIEFGYEGEVTMEDTAQILDRIRAAGAAQDPERKLGIEFFAESLQKAFYSFDSDFFQQNVTRMVDDVISQFKGSLDLWPTLIEICYYAKSKKAFPQVRVCNKTSSRLVNKTPPRPKIPPLTPSS
jgi:hypothetical protein